ncbi:NAD(P)-binding Rossmann-fold containing protein [Glarea lozoyensis ATCC 20868]|uniref:NAD(P)-binding Rossmann-fold containing protein n=1 Tax=Glarea lozoyensis (strain ATCC 20868 / MF5171) TaxID=1116229 RepID=S3D2L1_GLAL2|nr:NAD(P)-binding Rossmann-fold containing protein [Glarea lozoyensis ATCC 20868]EPE32065.1 NAD(P)-binding Rossmann-fold containing protein [Glarea lozoyensis ATCC 20868]
MAGSTPFVAVAGATGHLGSLIVLNLCKKDVAVKALIRPGTSGSRTQHLREAGCQITEVDMTDVPTLTEALTGATTVVSALQGLKGVIIDAQGALLEAAMAAKVRRFIPSDFSLDFTKTTPGTNRNLDLRREFHAKLDASGIEWTSVLNGCFMEVVTTRQMPLINDAFHLITHFGSVDQKMDVTTVPDVAAYTAAVAADPHPKPKFLRIAGDVFTAKEMAVVMTKLRGKQFTTQWVGSAGFLSILIGVLKLFIGGVEDKLFPPWQGMQYMLNMISGEGKLNPLDNDRYPELKWTSVEQAIREADAAKAKEKST